MEPAAELCKLRSEEHCDTGPAWLENNGSVRDAVRCTYQATALGLRGPYGTALAAHIAARGPPACIDTPDRALAI